VNAELNKKVSSLFLKQFTEMITRIKYPILQTLQSSVCFSLC